METGAPVIEPQWHHQITREPMNFLSLADWTGIVGWEQSTFCFALAS